MTVVPPLSGDWQHNYSTKTRHEGHANEQSMYSLMSMAFSREYLRGNLLFDWFGISCMTTVN
jgi:hypothetical protein